MGNIQKDSNFDYGAAGIPPEDVERLLALKEQNLSMGRQNAEQAFARGELLCSAAAILTVEAEEGAEEDGDAETGGKQGGKGQESRFHNWVRSEAEISPRHASNYMAVARNLSPFRKRIIQQAVAPTILFTIASAPAETVEAVVAAFEEGRRLKVREVKALLPGGAAASAEEQATERGGVRELLQIGLDKARRSTGELTEHLLGILVPVHAALEPATRARRVEKGKLAEAICGTVKVAERELTELACCVRVTPYTVGSNAPSFMHEESLPEAWAEFHELLKKLRYPANWGEATQLVTWLTGAVVPQFLWALDGAVPKKLAAEIVATLAAVEAARARKPTRAAKRQTAATPSAPVHAGRRVSTEEKAAVAA